MSTEIVVRRTLAVPREEVFDAWLDAPNMSEWMCPGEGTAAAEIDARVGGKFRIVMTHSDGSTEHTGEYLKIDRPSLLSFTWKSAYTYDQSTDRVPRARGRYGADPHASPPPARPHRGAPRRLDGHPPQAQRRAYGLTAQHADRDSCSGRLSRSTTNASHSLPSGSRTQVLFWFA